MVREFETLEFRVAVNSPTHLREFVKSGILEIVKLWDAWERNRGIGKMEGEVG